MARTACARQLFQLFPIRMLVLVPILLCQRRPVQVPNLPLFLNPNMHQSIKQSPNLSPNPLPRKRTHKGGVREREQENGGTKSPVFVGSKW